MAKVKTTLIIEAGGKSTTFTNSKTYTEETVNKFYVDATDGFTDLLAFSPDDESPSKTCTATAAPKSFSIYNSGKTGIEIQLQTADWAANSTQTAATDYLSMMLGAGEMFFSNQMRLIMNADGNSSALGQSTSLALASDKVSTALTATVARGGDMGCDTDTEDAADSTTVAVDDGAEKFRAGDYIYVDATTDDVYRVVSVDSATSMTVERGVLGYTAQILQNNSDVYMYAGSHLHNKGTEDDSGVNIRTDKQGRFRGQLLGDSGAVPRGTAATAVAGGIVPGSVSIQFPLHGGYQNLGVAVSSTDSTGLTASTAYAFRITDSIGTTSDIEFTTDSSDVSWGKVIALINTAFDDAGLDYTCGIVNGDVRFSAKKWIDGDSITLVDDADSSNEPWGVGNVPDTAAHESPITTRFPFATVTDVGSGKKIKNIKHMLIDDGNGNLVGDVGSGTIDYDTGICDFTSLYRAEFKTSFAYGSAHAGIPTRSSGLENMVSIIAARSMNALKNAEVTIICYS